MCINDLLESEELIFAKLVVKLGHLKIFNGSQENENAPKPLAGKEVYDLVRDIITIFGKTQKKPSSETNI